MPNDNVNEQHHADTERGHTDLRQVYNGLLRSAENSHGEARSVGGYTSDTVTSQLARVAAYERGFAYYDAANRIQTVLRTLDSADAHLAGAMDQEGPYTGGDASKILSMMDHFSAGSVDELLETVFDLSAKFEALRKVQRSAQGSTRDLNSVVPGVVVTGIRYEGTSEEYRATGVFKSHFGDDRSIIDIAHIDGPHREWLEVAVSTSTLAWPTQEEDLRFGQVLQQSGLTVEVPSK